MSENTQKPNENEQLQGICAFDEAPLIVQDFLPEDMPEINQDELAQNLAILLYGTVNKHLQSGFMLKLQSNLRKLNNTALPIGRHQIALATIELLDDLSQLTETKADDKIVNIARIVYNVITGNAPVVQLLAKIAERIKERRANRRERREERRERRQQNKNK